MSQVPEATQVSIASLYVGDLKPEINEQILWNVFSPYGQVLSVKICRDSQTHTSLGYGYVNFRTVLEAEKAMDHVNFSNIDGRPCRVMWSMRDPNRRKLGIGNLIIKNIDPMLDSKSLYQAFSAFGPVLSCKIALDEYGLSKGYGFIQFYNEKDAEVAMTRANGLVFSKKKLVVAKFIPRAARTDAKPVNPSDFTNVFVKNFGTDLTVDDLKKLFVKFGEITSCVIQKDENNKSLGFGFINYAKPSSACESVKEMDGFALSSGQKLFVSRAMKKLERQAFLRKEYEKKKREFYKQYQNLNLYVKNFDESVTTEKLKELFSGFGEIRSAMVMKDESGKSKGFGFVCFSNPDEAQAAITGMNQKVLDSKPLYVAFAQNKEDRKKLLEQQTYNTSFRAPMFAPGSMPFMYPHPGVMSYSHPSHFARFSHPMPNRPPNRAMQQMPPGGVQQGYQHGGRQGYSYYHNSAYSQNMHRPRSNMANVRPPHQNVHPPRGPPVQTTMNSVVTEVNQRPKREDVKADQNPTDVNTDSLKKSVYEVCQNVFVNERFDMNLLSRISGVVIDFFMNRRQNFEPTKDLIASTVMDAYNSFQTQNSQRTGR